MDKQLYDSPNRKKAIELLRKAHGLTTDARIYAEKEFEKAEEFLREAEEEYADDLDFEVDDARGDLVEAEGMLQILIDLEDESEEARELPTLLAATGLKNELLSASNEALSLGFPEIEGELRKAAKHAMSAQKLLRSTRPKKR